MFRLSTLEYTQGNIFWHDLFIPDELVSTDGMLLGPVPLSRFTCVVTGAGAGSSTLDDEITHVSNTVPPVNYNENCFTVNTVQSTKQCIVFNMVLAVNEQKYYRRKYLCTY